MNCCQGATLPSRLEELVNRETDAYSLSCCVRHHQSMTPTSRNTGEKWGTL
jgi:hypothetical protein